MMPGRSITFILMCICSLIFFSTPCACAVLYCHLWPFRLCYIFRRFVKIAENNYQLRQVDPPVHMEQLGSHWTDLMKFEDFEKIQVSLKPDKNNGYYMWRPIYILYHISLSSSYNGKCFRQTLWRISKYIVYRGADKSLVRPGRKQDNVSIRKTWIFFGTLLCRKKELDDSSLLDVEIARNVYQHHHHRHKNNIHNKAKCFTNQQWLVLD